jgi:hypothetical protein
LASASIAHRGIRYFDQFLMTTANRCCKDKVACHGELRSSTSDHPCHGTVQIVSSTICQPKERE